MLKRTLLAITLGVIFILTNSFAIGRDIEYRVYFGNIVDNTDTSLHMVSDKYGEYTMNIADGTLFIDDANMSVIESFKGYNNAYVYHSAIATMSLPPQSNAYAIVVNTPMDRSVVQMYTIHTISRQKEFTEVTMINTDDSFKFNEYTSIYNANNQKISVDNLIAGDKLLIWGNENNIIKAILLPRENEYNTRYASRLDVVKHLHNLSGNPVVNYALTYSDMINDGVEALRWATSIGVVSGYPDNTFRGGDSITLQDLLTIVWRFNGSNDIYNSEFDKYDIPEYAKKAVYTAYKDGLISADNNLSESLNQNITISDMINILNTVK